jgi:hypothetical protein
MSLKVEQRLDDFFFTESEPKIYTTGAHLVPMEIRRGKKIRYVWVVDQFDDDTYIDGDLCSPNVYANIKANLLNKT